EPNSTAPAGSHWYYHVDKATQRKCWYIRATDRSAQPASDQSSSEQASSDQASSDQDSSNPASLPPAPAISAEKPAAASASGTISISPGDGTPPLPHSKVVPVKPKRSAISGATANQALQQNAPKVTPQSSSASSTPGAPAPQVNLSQTTDQGAAIRPSIATPAWPDQPPVAAVPQEPAAPPGDARTESLRPTVDTSVSDDSKTTDRDNASTTNATAATTSASRMPVEMFAIAAFGLL